MVGSVAPAVAARAVLLAGPALIALAAVVRLIGLAALLVVRVTGRILDVAVILVALLVVRVAGGVLDVTLLVVRVAGRVLDVTLLVARVAGRVLDVTLLVVRTALLVVRIADRVDGVGASLVDGVGGSLRVLRRVLRLGRGRVLRRGRVRYGECPADDQDERDARHRETAGETMDVVHVLAPSLGGLAVSRS